MPASGMSIFTGQTQQASIYSSSALRVSELHEEGSASHPSHEKPCTAATMGAHAACHGCLRHRATAACAVRTCHQQKEHVGACSSELSPYLDDSAQVIVRGVFLTELICKALQAVQGQGMAKHLHRIVHLKACPDKQTQQASLHRLQKGLGTQGIHVLLVQRVWACRLYTGYVPGVPTWDAGSDRPDPTAKSVAAMPAANGSRMRPQPEKPQCAARQVTLSALGASQHKHEACTRRDTQARPRCNEQPQGALSAPRGAQAARIRLRCCCMAFFSRSRSFLAPAACSAALASAAAFSAASSAALASSSSCLARAAWAFSCFRRSLHSPLQLAG